MNRLTAALACAGLVGLAGCDPAARAPHAGQATEQAQAMQQMKMDVDAIAAFTGSKIARSDALAASQDLLAWSKRLPDLFPAAQVSALYVDLTPEMAQAAPDAMRRTADRLAATLVSASPADVAVQLTVTETQGCGACHRKGYQ